MEWTRNRADWHLVYHQRGTDQQGHAHEEKLSVMTLEITLADITERLRQGRFANEQAISQGIVLHLFQELGWDTWDTSIVWPEYQTGESRVDFALCHPPSKPAVFIEVKQPRKAEDDVRQTLL